MGKRMEHVQRHIVSYKDLLCPGEREKFRVPAYGIAGQGWKGWSKKIGKVLRSLGFIPVTQRYNKI